MTDRPGHHAPLDYHVALLADPWRMAAWDRAIRAVIRPGDRVLDVGTGTGVLAVLAARAGAHVIAVESAWIAEIAAETVRRNGVADRVSVVYAALQEVPPQPVDVVIGDWVGRLVPEKQLGEAMIAACAWSHSGTRWLPAAVEVVAAPVGDATLPGLARFLHPVVGVDLGAALPAAWSNASYVHLGQGALLSPPQVLATWVAPAFPTGLAWEGRFVAERDGRMQGVAAWFRSRFTAGIDLDTGPGRRTFWGQVLWPCPEVEVRAGDEVRLAVRATSQVGAVDFAWELVVVRARAVLLRHVAYSRPLATPPMDGAPPVSPARSNREVGLERWAAGDADLAAPELYASDASDAEVAAARIEVAAARGEEVALAWLQEYELRFGPHPRVHVREAAPDPSAPQRR